jgi:hypothetical protein
MRVFSSLKRSDAGLVGSIQKVSAFKPEFPGLLIADVDVGFRVKKSFIRPICVIKEAKVTVEFHTRGQGLRFTK